MGDQWGKDVNGERLLMGLGYLLGGNENVLELNSDDGYTTL